MVVMYVNNYSNTTNLVEFLCLADLTSCHGSLVPSKQLLSLTLCNVLLWIFCLVTFEMQEQLNIDTLLL